MNYGLGTCKICQITYAKKSHNSQVCSDECRSRKDRERKAAAEALKRPHAPCPVCGQPGKNYRGRVYLTCGSTSCRLTLRKQWYATHVRQPKPESVSGGVERECLKCGKPFSAQNRYIRLCGDCKSSINANTTGHGWWGKQI